jgi:hypothetical protein
MAVGAQPSRERWNLVFQPTQANQALRTTRHEPYLAPDTLTGSSRRAQRLRRLRDGPLMERQYTAGQRSWWLRLGGLAQLGSAADGARKSGRAGGSGASRERVLRSKRAGVASAPGGEVVPRTLNGQYSGVFAS